MINVPPNYWPLHKQVWWEEHGNLTYNQRVAVLSNPHSPLGKRLADKVHAMVLDELGANKNKK